MESSLSPAAAPAVASGSATVEQTGAEAASEIRRAYFQIQTEPIAPRNLLAARSDEGARLVFTGLVRDYNHSQAGVSSIEYHCYREMAESEGLRILEAALEQFEIQRAACLHRVGLLQLQDTAIHLEIGSGHRLAALKACEYIMDQIKLHVPIWKKEFYQDQKAAEWT